MVTRFPVTDCAEVFSPTKRSNKKISINFRIVAFIMDGLENFESAKLHRGESLVDSIHDLRL